MSPEVTDVRIELRSNEVWPGWFFHCAFAGRTWSGRFYGRDWEFRGNGDEDAWKALSKVHRDVFRTRIVAELQEAQRTDWHRRNNRRQFEQGMRFLQRVALRDRALQGPVTRLDVLMQAAGRHVDKGRAVRSNRRIVRTASSRGDPDPDPEPEPPPLVRPRRAVGAWSA